jgi:PRTRC genetic system protein E
MFVELLPILRDRVVMISVTHLENDSLRVSIIPKMLKEGENTALTEPFTVEGTAEEMDSQIPNAIIGYTASHLALKNTLEQTQATIAAAAAEAKKEAAAKVKNRPGAAKAPASGNADSKAETAKPEPAAPSLFDLPPQAPVESPAAPVAIEAAESPNAETTETTTEDAEEDADGTENSPA